MSRIENNYRLYMVAESAPPEYEGSEPNDRDRLYLPWRASIKAAALIHEGMQVWTILPENERFIEYLSLLSSELLNGKRIPTQFVPDNHFTMDKNIQEPARERLRKEATKYKEVIIYPYQATDEFYEWALPLQQGFEAGRIQIYADKREKNNRKDWTNKGAYHRWIDNQGEKSLTDEYQLAFPEGYIAQNLQEAQQAWHLLNEKGITNIIMKPIFGAGGMGISSYATDTEMAKYQWPIDPAIGLAMPVAIQQKVQIEHDKYGECAYSMQFHGNTIDGRLTRQRMHDNEWIGNNIVSAAGQTQIEAISTEFEIACIQETQKVLAAIHPIGKGGIDFAKVVGSERPVIIEINGGRPTAADLGKRYQTFVPKIPHLIIEKIDISGSRFTAHDAWRQIKNQTMPREKASIGLNKDTQTGVFPIWLFDTWAMLASSASTFERAQTQLSQAYEALGVGA